MAEEGPLSQADIDALTAGLLGEASGDSLDIAAIRPEVDSVLDQGTSILGTLLNRQAAMTARDVREADIGALAEGMELDGVIVRLAMEHGFPGELCLLVHKETAALLCGLMMGGDGKAPFKEEDMDALNEFGNQFMGAICTSLGSRFGVNITPAQAQTSKFDPDQPPFEMEGAALVEAGLAIEGHPESIFRLLLSPSLAAKLGGASGGPDIPGGGRGDNPLANLGGFDDSLTRSLDDSPPNIQMLLDINLNVTIELGRTRLSIRKVLELGPGSIIELDRLAGEPVDLLVNDKVVAKGEVVVVDEYFGIRIISLVSPEERIKQLK